MSKEKLTPVEWLLNELDERDMIDKTIYHKKDRTFESISEQALNMEKEYASQSKKTEVVCPTDKCIEEWFAAGMETETFWQDAPFKTNGDVVEEIKSALKYFYGKWQGLATPPTPTE